jgi:hypothetical protein
LITGHEKGNIVVWHNVVQFYLTAVAQALQTRDGAADSVAEELAPSKASKHSKKDKKAHKKEKHTVLEYTATTLPLCTTLHWHAHAGMCAAPSPWMIFLPFFLVDEALQRREVLVVCCS